MILKKKMIEEGKRKGTHKSLDKIHKYKTMLSYCLKCGKNTENINPRILGTSNGKTMT